MRPPGQELVFATGLWPGGQEARPGQEAILAFWGRSGTIGCLLFDCGRHDCICRAGPALAGHGWSLVSMDWARLGKIGKG